MRRPPRIVLLSAVLAALALWVAVDSRSRTGPDGMSTAESPARLPAQGAGSAGAGAGRLEPPARSAFGPLRKDPFRPESWRQAAAPAPRRKPAPAAPPLPFRYVGRVYVNDGSMVFVKQGAKLLVVKKGDTVDGTYLVESVGPTEITFLYRPSRTRQTLRISAPLEGARPAS